MGSELTLTQDDAEDPEQDEGDEDLGGELAPVTEVPAPPCPEDREQQKSRDVDPDEELGREKGPGSPPGPGRLGRQSSQETMSIQPWPVPAVPERTFMRS